MLFNLASEPASAAEVRSYGLASTLERRHAELTAEVDRRSLSRGARRAHGCKVFWTLYATCLMGAMAFGLADPPLAQTARLLDRRLGRADLHPQHRRPTALAGGPCRRRARRGRDIAAARAAGGADRGARRLLPLIGDGGGGPARPRLRAARRPDRGAGRRERLREDDAGEAAPGYVPAGCRRDPRRRHPARGARPGGLARPERLPDGLATRVGTAYTGGHNLFGGQWQRLALGRAMRREAILLTILDEPTASLDPVAEYTLFRRYAEETGGVTVLVSHRLSTARMADRIVYLDAGRVLEAGTHDALTAFAGHYAELFEIQAAAYR